MGRKSIENGAGLKSMERRMSTDCNYSVLSTMLMQFLKKENLYELSKGQVQKMGITSEKNYSIIVFRIALYYRYMNFMGKRGNQSTNVKIGTASQGAKQIWVWLENSLGSCVNQKYFQKCPQFKESVKNKCLKAIKVLRSVFEDGDFNNVDNIKGKVLKIYDNKRGKKHSKTHQKFAQKLAELAVKMLENVQDNLINFDELSSSMASRISKSIQIQNTEEIYTFAMDDSNFKSCFQSKTSNISFNESLSNEIDNKKQLEEIQNAQVNEYIFNETYENSQLEQLIPMTGFDFRLMLGQDEDKVNLYFQEVSNQGCL